MTYVAEHDDADGDQNNDNDISSYAPRRPSSGYPGVTSATATATTATDAEISHETAVVVSESSSTESQSTASPSAGCRRYLQRNISEPFDRCADDYPRTCAIFCHVLVPLCFLMILAAVGGRILSTYESEVEYITNDSVLSNRFLEDTFDIDKFADQLLDLPTNCLIEVLNDTSVVDNRITFYDLLITPGLIKNLTSPTTAFFGDFFNDPEEAEESLLEALSFYLTYAQNLTEECVSEADAIVDLIQQFDNVTNLAIANQDLTFNWVRCANSSEVENFQDLVYQSQNQAELYERVWNQNRIELYDAFYDYFRGENDDIKDLVDVDGASNATTPEMYNMTAENAAGNAFILSTFLASGRSVCSHNDGGSTWFFFTIMTTIGYGNQAPVTTAGRVTAVIFGFVSIVAFASLLATTGAVVDALYEDFVKRLRAPCLSRPISTLTVFAILTTGWLCFVAFCANVFWVYRLPDDESIPSPGDSIWFAFISILTVGLGDLFLQPEYIWIGDAILFSFVILVGFVLLAAFLTQLSNLFHGPDWVSPRERLQQRMEKTRNICCFSGTSNDGQDDTDNNDNDVDQHDDEVEQIGQPDASANVSSQGEIAETESVPPPVPSNDAILSMLNTLSTHANDRDKSISTLKNEYNLLQKMLALKGEEINNLQ
mmetsp:Transcript_34450/g.83081  ORF Transcript_34450/g.83081 Transcript_34450/m.83081 type:complete len:658 (+) Transcript_34450:381-2354(+)